MFKYKHVDLTANYRIFIAPVASAYVFYFLQHSGGPAEALSKAKRVGGQLDTRPPDRPLLIRLLIIIFLLRL